MTVHFCQKQHEMGTMTSTLVLFYLIYRNLLVFHFFLPLSDVEVQQPVKSWQVFCISLCYFISHDVLKIKWHSFNPFTVTDLLSKIHTKAQSWHAFSGCVTCRIFLEARIHCVSKYTEEYRMTVATLLLLGGLVTPHPLPSQVEWACSACVITGTRVVLPSAEGLQIFKNSVGVSVTAGASSSEPHAVSSPIYWNMTQSLLSLAHRGRSGMRCLAAKRPGRFYYAICIYTYSLTFTKPSWHWECIIARNVQQWKDSVAILVLQ